MAQDATVGAATVTGADGQTYSNTYYGRGCVQLNKADLIAGYAEKLEACFTGSRNTLNCDVAAE